MEGSNATLELCRLPYARGNGTEPGTCDCNGGFSGPTCESLLPWWIPLQWSIYIFNIVSMFILFVWSALKLVHVVFLTPSERNRTKLNLAMASMIFNFFGNLSRVIFRSYQWRIVTVDYDTPQPLGYQVTVIVLNTLGFALWIASFAIIMGFWADALYSRMHVRMALKTKIICILCAVSVLIMIPGLVLVLLLDQFMMGTIMIILPYMVNTTLFITLTIIIRVDCCETQMGKKSRPPETRMKIAHVSRYFTIGSIAWCIITVNGASSGIFKDSPGTGNLVILFAAVNSITEVVAVIATMMLVEQNVGPIKVFHDVVTWTRSEVPSMISSGTDDSTISSTKESTKTVSSGEIMSGTRQTTTSPKTDDEAEVVNVEEDS